MEILEKSVPVLLLALSIEAIYCNYHLPHAYDKKDTIVNIFLGLGMTFLGGLNVLSQFSLFSWSHQFKLFDFDNGILVCIVTYALYDLCLYWSHRFAHTIRFLWASHVVHHSSSKFNLSTAARQPLTDSLFEVLFTIWMPFMGFSPETMVACHSINMVYQFFLHTETVQKLPRFYEYMFNTPSHHRVHHGINEKYIDKNFGCTLIIWDRIFGTFQKEEEQPVYGILHPISTYNPLKIVYHEWWAMGKDIILKSKDFRSLYLLVFGAPGWNLPDTREKDQTCKK